MIPLLQPRSLPQHRLAIWPILAKGYMLHIGLYAPGMRIVSIEHPDSRLRRRRVVARAGHVDIALGRAIAAYYLGAPGSRPPVRLRRPAYVRECNRRLDAWLAGHNGSLHAVCDTDGTIRVRLQGVAGRLPAGASVLIEGYGPTFYAAVRSALQATQRSVRQRPARA